MSHNTPLKIEDENVETLLQLLYQESLAAPRFEKNLSSPHYNEEISRYFSVIQALISGCFTPATPGELLEDQVLSTLRLLLHALDRVPHVLLQNCRSETTDNVVFSEWLLVKLFNLTIHSTPVQYEKFAPRLVQTLQEILKVNLFLLNSGSTRANLKVLFRRLFKDLEIIRKREKYPCKLNLINIGIKFEKPIELHTVTSLLLKFFAILQEPIILPEEIFIFCQDVLNDNLTPSSEFLVLVCLKCSASLLLSLPLEMRKSIIGVYLQFSFALLSSSSYSPRSDRTLIEKLEKALTNCFSTWLVSGFEIEIGWGYAFRQLFQIPGFFDDSCSLKSSIIDMFTQFLKSNPDAKLPESLFKLLIDGFVMDYYQDSLIKCLNQAISNQCSAQDYPKMLYRYDPVDLLTIMLTNYTKGKPLKDEQLLILKGIIKILPSSEKIHQIIINFVKNTIKHASNIEEDTLLILYYEILAICSNIISTDQSLVEAIFSLCLLPWSWSTISKCFSDPKSLLLRQIQTPRQFEDNESWEKMVNVVLDVLANYNWNSKEFSEAIIEAVIFALKNGTALLKEKILSKIVKILHHNKTALNEQINDTIMEASSIIPIEILTPELINHLGILCCFLSGELLNSGSCQNCDTKACDRINNFKGYSIDPTIWDNWTTIITTKKEPASALKVSLVNAASRLASHSKRTGMLNSTLIRECMKGILSGVPQLREASSILILKAWKSHENDQPVILSFIVKALQTKRFELKQFLLSILVNLSECVGIEDYSFQQILLILSAHAIEFEQDPQSVFQLIELIGEKRNTRVRDFYLTVKLPLALQFIENLTMIPRLSIVSEKLLGMSLKDFLQGGREFLIPELVKRRDKTTLMRYSVVIEEEIVSLCINNIEQVLSVCFLELEDQELELGVLFVVDIISEHSGQPISVDNLIRSCPLKLTVNLVLELGSEDPVRSEKAKKALSIIQTRIDPTADGLTQFLEPYLLGILSSADLVINEPDYSLPKKQTVLRSLRELVKLMGTLVIRVEPQLVALVQTATANPDLRKLGIEVVVALVTEMPELDDLSLILVALLNKLQPLLTTDEADMAGIVLNKIVSLKGENRFNVFSPFPNQAYYACFNEAVIKANENLDYKTRLGLLLELMNHDNTMVVLYMLKQIKQILNDHFPVRATNLKDSDIVEKLVRELLRVLSHPGDKELRLQSAECFGILGAIDPSRLDQAALLPKFDPILYDLDLHDDRIDFVFELIQKLGGSFRSARDTKFQGFLAFAIQELLKITCLTPSALLSSPPRGQQQDRARMRWDGLPLKLRNAIFPLLSSRYVAHTSPTSKLCPLFPSLINGGIEQWLPVWTCQLIDRVKHFDAAQIFRPCELALMDLKITSFLLPHVALMLITTGDEQDRKDISTEIMAVLKGDDESSKLIVFNLLDHLSFWYNLKKERKANVKQTRKKTKHLIMDNTQDYDLSGVYLENVLGRIPQNCLASAAYKCKNFARALRHWEQQLRSTGERGETFLQELYVSLEEPDGVVGACMISTELSTRQQILFLESIGAWSQAQTCLEIALRQNPSGGLYSWLLRNLKLAGHYEISLALVDSCPREEWKSLLYNEAVEASWNLQNWDKMNSYLSKSGKDSFESNLGKLLSLRCNTSLTSGNLMTEEVQAYIVKTREQLLEAAVGVESYHQAYQRLLKLHILHEIEVYDTCQHDESLWASRLELSQSTFNSRQQLLAIRRVLSYSTSSSTIAWLQTSRLARKNKYFEAAWAAVQVPPTTPLTLLEQAKVLWAQQAGLRPIAILKQALRMIPAPTSQDDSSTGVSALVGKDILLDKSSSSFTRARLLLLQTRWTAELNLCNSNTILLQYSALTKDFPQWEKGYFYFGRYYDKLLENSRISTSTSWINEQVLNLVYLACKNYARALSFGPKFIYQALPRLMTLWLEFSVLGPITVENFDDRMERKLDYLVTVITSLKDSIPSYMFLAVLSQMTSRICHTDTKTVHLLEQMLLKVLTDYPQQTLWAMTGSFHSSSKLRASRCRQIWNQAALLDSSGELDLLIKQMTKLTDLLIKLCNHKTNQKEAVLSLSKTFIELGRLKDLSINVPIQQSLVLSLPPGPEKLYSHNPYSEDLPQIKAFDDKIIVMNSLQRPKKITIVGSDGENYEFLCKPNDDLRKDARLMEVNNLINRLLTKDMEARRRQLRVRTYAVSPLNEECGLIEWVPNTVGLRPILLKGYHVKGLQVNSSEIRKLFEHTQPSKLESVFLNTILPKYPPIFHEWFLYNFPEPSAWYTARLSYTRTSAVMSMVGYILGLGDRHGENILFDELTGDCIHVDFNCLFEKGLTFEKPERVPFRLTQNLVDAFGVTGYEGLFKVACAVTLSLLRNHRETLICILETFIHDPLWEWVKPSSSSGKLSKSSTATTGEESQANKALSLIQRKLGGYMHAGLPLSVEGQVAELIQQATDPKNLSRMFIGWAPHL